MDHKKDHMKDLIDSARNYFRGIELAHYCKEFESHGKFCILCKEYHDPVRHRLKLMLSPDLKEQPHKREIQHVSTPFKIADIISGEKFHAPYDRTDLHEYECGWAVVGIELLDALTPAKLEGMKSRLVSAGATVAANDKIARDIALVHALLDYLQKHKIKNIDNLSIESFYSEFMAGAKVDTIPDCEIGELVYLMNAACEEIKYRRLNTVPSV